MSGVQLEIHFGNVWEAIADQVGDRTALVHGDQSISWRQYDDSAARLAQGLLEQGVRPNSKVAMYLYNGVEYAVVQYAAFKIRAVPVNVNYRYTETELLYLLENSDAEVLVFHASLGARVERVIGKASKLRAVIEVADSVDHLDGALRFDDVVREHDPAPRTVGQADDIYMLYTGGTTGMPKGVMYPQGAFTLLRASFAATVAGLEERPTNFDELLALGDKVGSPPTWLSACPQMHASGMWLGTMSPLLLKGTVVTLTDRSFNAHQFWQEIERNHVSVAVIVGDAFAKPMLEALKEGGYTAFSLKAIVSSGVVWSTQVKKDLLARLDITLHDGLGSTEGSIGGMTSSRFTISEETKFTVSPAVKVIKDDGSLVQPGTGQVGMLATPTAALGYYKDIERSARTFITIDGARYAKSGDWGRVDADGTITFLGRGSNIINTGGEKVFSEEVEEAVKSHSAVYDCVVVGVPDERLGQRVTAVASLHPGMVPTSAEIVEAASQRIARYKLPKQIFFVADVRRAPNGKPDYPWARRVVGGGGEVRQS
jgi:fatty-acyl-CoA synthase